MNNEFIHLSCTKSSKWSYDHVRFSWRTKIKQHKLRKENNYWKLVSTPEYFAVIDIFYLWQGNILLFHCWQHNCETINCKGLNRCLTDEYFIIRLRLNQNFTLLFYDWFVVNSCIYRVSYSCELMRKSKFTETKDKKVFNFDSWTQS